MKPEQRGSLQTVGDLSRLGNQGIPQFTFSIGKKMSKSFPFGKQNYQFLYASAYWPADKYKSTDRLDDFTSQILNELSRISPIGFL